MVAREGILFGDGGDELPRSIRRWSIDPIAAVPARESIVFAAEAQLFVVRELIASAAKAWLFVASDSTAFAADG